MATLSKLQPGQILYQRMRVKMGNTNMSRTAIYTVKVLEVHEDHIIASWNGNTPRKWRERDIAKLLVKEPAKKEAW